MGFSSILIAVISAHISLTPSTVTASNESNIQVIGAGYGRTGTDSLRLALNTLGFKTYHMMEVLGLGERQPSPLEMLGLISGHNDHWARVDQDIGSGMEPDFGFLHSNTEYNFTAAIDAPAAMFFDQLLKQNPNAKVILTTRDPDAWHKSINQAFCRLIGSGTLLDKIVSVLTFIRPFGVRWKRMLLAHESNTRRLLTGAANTKQFNIKTYSTPAICDNKQYALEFFQIWNDRVREIVPKRQLLEFETGKNGFKELAKFLGLDVPKDSISGSVMEYPHSNSSEEFQFIINIHRFLAGITVIAMGLVIWFLCVYRRRMVWTSLAASQAKKEH